MANLEKIASQLNIDISNTLNQENARRKAPGQKRRAWLVEDTSFEDKPDISFLPPDNKGVNKPLFEKGSINPVNEPLIQKGLMNAVDEPGSLTRSINLVNKPLFKNTENKVYRPLSLSLTNLRGRPLLLMQYFFQLSDSETEQVTPKVTLSGIMQSLELTRDSARTALRFLIKNELVERTNFKPGRDGWSQYLIKKTIFIEMKEAEKKGAINPIKSVLKNMHEKGSNSSSNIINKTTTTEINPFSWEDIDISPLEEFGFNKNHVFQLREKNAPEIVQESINHFAFGLNFNSKTKKYDDPINVLMGVLRKGGVWTENNYRSQQEIAKEKLLELKRAERERLAKMDEEMLQLNFEEWLSKLKDTEKNEILKDFSVTGKMPESVVCNLKKAHLLSYFKKL